MEGHMSELFRGGTTKLAQTLSPASWEKHLTSRSQVLRVLHRVDVRVDKVMSRNCTYKY